jgi:PhnB protein
MLGPEIPQRGARTAKSIGASPVTLYLTSENVDKTVAKALKLGATAQGPVMDMFWGDRCGTVIDPDGNSWMIGTHIVEPTPKEMSKKIKQQIQLGQDAAAANAA